MTARSLVVRLPILSLLLCASLASAAPSKPDDEAKQKAKTEYLEGMKSYNLSEFQPALERFKEAYRSYPDASFLFNIAQCQRQLGQKAEAVKSYRAFLRTSPRTGARNEVEAIIASLEKTLAEEQAAKGAKPTGTLGPGETAVTEPPTTPQPTPTPVEPKPTPTVTPTPTPEPNPTITPAPQTTVVASPPPKKRTGMWIAIGVVVGLVVVGGVGAGVGIALSKTSYPSADVNGPTYRF